MRGIDHLSQRAPVICVISIQSLTGATEETARKLCYAQFLSTIPAFVCKGRRVLFDSKCRVESVCIGESKHNAQWRKRKTPQE
ncbi:hypothetical protein BaRGS_00038050 [Batillaria attramentaria]|uniref:Secreted protein n=1 Tax=Batillaria attramentaria TaxID=370345 RepID=A0ABD0J703_9CAEN